MDAPFERILVPIDFSSAARAAFTLAMRIAERWGSEVICFYTSGTDGNDEFLNATGISWGESDILAEARDHLRGFAEAVVPGSADRVRIDATKEDDPVKAVIAACERHDPSLVVLGLHPHQHRRLLRSHAERIAHALRCAVMLVPGEPDLGGEVA